MIARHPRRSVTASLLAIPLALALIIAGHGEALAASAADENAGSKSAETEFPLGLPLCIPNITDNLDEVVARLDGQEITIRDLDEEMAKRPIYAPLIEQARENPLVLSELRPKILEAMLGVRLLVRAAKKSGAIKASEVQSRLEAVRKRGATDGSEQDPRSSRIGSQVEPGVTEDDMWVKLYLDHLYRNVTVSEDEIRKEYNRALDDARKRTLVRASVILISVPDGASPLDEAKALARAQDIHAQAQNPASSFSELASKYSEHESVQSAGYLGEVEPGEYGIEFERAIVNMKSGDVSPPVRTLRGYTIIKLVEKDGPQMPAYTSIHEALRNTILKNKRFHLMEDAVFDLAEKAEIEVNLYGFRFGE